MKLTILPACILMIALLFACNSDDRDRDNFSFRIKMIVNYVNDVAQQKTIYTYKDNKLDSIKYYRNNFASNIYNSFDYLVHYEYSGNSVELISGQFKGNMVPSSAATELKYENGMMVQYGNENYTYENGLLKERTNENYKSAYDYDGDKLIRITQYKFDVETNEFMLYVKLDLEYIDNITRITRYFYNNRTQDWNIDHRVEKYYANNLCTRFDEFQFSGEFNQISSRIFYYDEHGNMFQTETTSYNETYYYAYVNTYDKYGNLIEVKSNNSKTTYQYEVGRTNFKELEKPIDPNSLMWTY